MRTIYSLIRINQWIKNLFVFVAAFFGKAINTENIQLLSISFLSFSLTASAIYIINDYRDVDSDKKHPTKKNRPIAAGKVTPILALSISFLLIASAISISYSFLKTSFTAIIAVYFLLNLFYSFGLKKVSIIDLIIVSSGFVLRVVAGAVTISIEVSFWLLLMTFLFSMFIVVGKRRDDFELGEENAVNLRVVNSFYNQKFLDFTIVIFSSLMLVCYVMYTYFSPYFSSSIYLALISSVLVFAGLLRYLQAIFVEGKGGNPTAFALKDRFIQVVIILWLSIFGFLIYFS